MKKLDRTQFTRRRIFGLGIMALGITVLFTPVLVGEWVIGLLGIALIAAGLFQFVRILRSGNKTTSYIAYAAGVATILIGVLLLLSPKMALWGVFAGVILFLLIEGAIKLYGTYQQTGAERWWNLFNGLLTIAFAGLMVVFLSANMGVAAAGLLLGLKLIVEGWSMFLIPEAWQPGYDLTANISEHPDRQLELEPSEILREAHEKILETEPTEPTPHIFVCLTFLGTFFAIHVLRTDAQWSYIGLISPFAAVIGDTIVALILAVVIVLPVRLLWRSITRPFERVSWYRIHRLVERGDDPTLGEKALRFWLESRMRFSLELRHFRYSLNYSFWRTLRIGLPLTAVLIAVNSIWGFSWYFNSENWASGVWQEITKGRVDPWRKRMAEDVEREAVANGIAPDRVFAIEPAGVNDEVDFGFIVIGDPGEGDQSQMSLRNQIIAANNREHVKFLVVSSDVVYPDGKMKDYERNFYLPFMGFNKPIYALPGNHDWFDANEGFNANFLDRDAANIALRSRLAEDLQTDIISTDERFAEIIGEAARLRTYYDINNGLQRGPYFEMHTAGFSLITVDTGILRSIDGKQEAWLEAALQRAGNNFKMVILGHPFYSGGRYDAQPDTPFIKLHETLKRYNVEVAIAGDRHDLEVYKEGYTEDNQPAEMLNIVNGGGGAYLSIGTSIGFPDKPVLNDYAFYPRTDEVTKKIRDEASFLRMPFFFWMQWLNGYPFDEEIVSGAFDFNRAPFFQSFFEVNVERSLSRVRLVPYGVNGRLRWRDLQVSGNIKPPDVHGDDLAEFVVPISPTNAQPLTP